MSLLQRNLSYILLQFMINKWLTLHTHCMITLYHSILRLISTTTIILKTLSIIINDETVIDKNEDHHYPHEVDIDMDDDDSADEDYEFHFS